MSNQVGAPIEAKKVALHLIKTSPPCHLNGDENGAQKTAIYNGVIRNRVSAANIAHAVRTSPILKNLLPIGTRSRMLPRDVLAELHRMQENDKDFAEVGEEFLMEAALKLTKVGKSGKDAPEKDDEDQKKSGKKKEERLITNQTILYTQGIVHELAEILRAEILKAKSFDEFKKLPLDMRKIPALHKIQDAPIPVDMALFGTMTTADFMRGADSAVQIGQAISTHALQREMDFFSCTDDLIESGEAAGFSGSALTGTTDFSCPCMYQYAAIDMGVLDRNMHDVLDGSDKTAAVAVAFIKAFALECSHTRQSRYASAVAPDVVMVEVFDDYEPAYSYAGAFKNPIKTFGDAPEVTKNSIKALANFADMQDKFLGRHVRRAFVSVEFPDEHPENAEICPDLNSLLKTVEKWIEE